LQEAKILTEEMARPSRCQEIRRFSESRAYTGISVVLTVLLAWPFHRPEKGKRD
jgi:hypothetical protein